MIVLRHADAMDTATAISELHSRAATVHDGRPVAAPSRSATELPKGSPAPDYDIANLSVRIAGPGDADALAELAKRAASPRPAGGLMVADAGDRLLAAVSITSGQALSEPTAAGVEAQAVVRYAVARLPGRGRTPGPIAA
jgi:hypothetical protein